MTQDPEPLTAHQLFFDIQALDPLHLHAHNGSALRGMVYNAVRELANEPQRGPDLQFADDPTLRRLLATLNEDDPRGKDVPRPYVIEPPILPRGDDVRAEHVLAPGDTFTFGIALFGDALEAFAVLVMALKHAEQRGLGRFLDDAHRQPSRGRFRVARATAQNPLTQTTQQLIGPGERLVNTPTVTITAADVRRQAERDVASGATRWRIHFHTPMTLTVRHEPFREPDFSVLVHRLIERLNALSLHHGGGQLACVPRREDRDARSALLRRADAVAKVEDNTRWLPLRGHSDRTRASTNLGGFVGTADFEAEDFAPFLEILRWGELTHAGQHTTKGNGLFRIQPL